MLKCVFLSFIYSSRVRHKILQVKPLPVRVTLKQTRSQGSVMENVHVPYNCMIDGYKDTLLVSLV